MKKYDAMTDESLALLYINGDNKAFDKLLSRTQSKLFSYIMFLVRDQETANDIFQDTFVKVITNLQEGKYADTGKFQYWVTRIAHNIIMDRYRMQNCEQIVDQGEDNDLSKLKSANMSDYSRETEMVNQQVMESVQQIMNALPLRQREVVYMRYYQDLPFKEIADITGVSINTSLGRMRYAIMNMRKIARDNNITLSLE